MKRLMVGAALGIALVLATTSAATLLGREAKRPKCPKGKVAWRIGGQQECLPVSSFAPPPKRGRASGNDLAARLFELDLHDDWSKPLGTPTIEQLLALSPQAPAATVTAFRDVASAFAVGSRSLSSARGNLPPGYTPNPDGSVSAVKDLGDGATLSVTGRGKGHSSTEDEAQAIGATHPPANAKLDDRYTEQQTEVKLSKSGASLKMSWSDGGSPLSVDQCPNGRGEVVGEASGSTKRSATFQAASGEEGTSVFSDKWNARFDGQVGDDAHLQYFDVEYNDVTSEQKSVRGETVAEEYRTHIAARVDARAARRGAAGSYTNWQGTTDVTTDQPGGLPVTPAQLRGLRQNNAQLRAEAFSLIVGKALSLFDRAEKVWYDAGDSVCVDVLYSPRPKTMKPGQRVVVSWTARSKVDRTQAPGRWELYFGPHQGTVDRKQARSEPHVPAEIAFTAANHLDKKKTTGYGMLVTSRAGRGERPWLVEPREGAPSAYVGTATGTETTTTPTGTLKGTLKGHNLRFRLLPNGSGYSLSEGTADWSYSGMVSGCTASSAATFSVQKGSLMGGLYFTNDRAGYHLLVPTYPASATQTIHVVCPDGHTETLSYGRSVVLINSDPAGVGKHYPTAADGSLRGSADAKVEGGGLSISIHWQWDLTPVP